MIEQVGVVAGDVIDDSLASVGVGAGGSRGGTSLRTFAQALGPFADTFGDFPAMLLPLAAPVFPLVGLFAVFLAHVSEAFAPFFHGLGLMLFPLLHLLVKVFLPLRDAVLVEVIEVKVELEGGDGRHGWNGEHGGEGGVWYVRNSRSRVFGSTVVPWGGAVFECDGELLEPVHQRGEACFESIDSLVDAVVVAVSDEAGGGARYDDLGGRHAWHDGERAFGG